jgi:hypothetical protein
VLADPRDGMMKVLIAGIELKKIPLAGGMHGAYSAKPSQSPSGLSAIPPLSLSPATAPQILHHFPKRYG